MGVSLCESCARVRAVLAPRGSRFLLCRLSAAHPTCPKYPRQPDVRCPGYANDPLTVFPEKPLDDPPATGRRRGSGVRRAQSVPRPRTHRVGR